MCDISVRWYLFRVYNYFRGLSLNENGNIFLSCILKLISFLKDICHIKHPHVIHAYMTPQLWYYAAIKGRTIILTYLTKKWWKTRAKVDVIKYIINKRDSENRTFETIKNSFCYFLLKTIFKKCCYRDKLTIYIVNTKNMFSLCGENGIFHYIPRNLL